MLARFENGWFLEVVHNKKEYNFHIYDEEGWCEDTGYTEYRSIDMYYPLDEIGYILEFCDPIGVDGEYEILPYKTMKEYEKFLEEDPNGKWCLERQGSEYDDIRYYKTAEAARTIMFKEFNEMAEDYYDLNKNDSYCSIGRSESFQSWTIYQKKTSRSKKGKLLNEIELELERIDTGVDQYAFELQDTWVIRNHIEKVEELIIELKEMM